MLTAHLLVQSVAQFTTSWLPIEFVEMIFSKVYFSKCQVHMWRKSTQELYLQIEILHLKSIGGGGVSGGRHTF